MADRIEFRGRGSQAPLPFLCCQFYTLHTAPDVRFHTMGPLAGLHGAPKMALWATEMEAVQ